MDYQEAMAAIAKAASEIFALAATEEDVCRLEQIIYDEIRRTAAEAEAGIAPQGA